MQDTLKGIDMAQNKFNNNIMYRRGTFKLTKNTSLASNKAGPSFKRNKHL